MRCKFCNTEYEDDRRYCPECGKRQDAKKPSEQEVEKKDTKSSKKTQSKKNVSNKSVAMGLVAGLLVAAFVVVLIVLARDSKPEQQPSTPTAPVSEYAQYSGVVVAKLGDHELTNDMLQILYMNMVGSFYQDYGSALSYFGLDLSKPLSEQEYPYQNEEEPNIKTWEDYFMNLSLERWKNYIAAMAMAEKDGFAISQERLQEIDNELKNLESMATKNGYASVDSMVKYSYGDCCSVEAYKEYMIMDATVRDYYASIYGVEITDQMLEESFEKNKDKLAEKGVTKTSGLTSSVRHILIGITGGTKDEQGNTVYSDAEWDACKKKAQDVLNEWKKGEATEQSFVALVGTHTTDTASIPDGGLYADINRESNFVDDFKNWAIDAKRKTGDTGLVKSPYGYHVMYFVKGEAEWRYFAKELVQEERMLALDEKIAKFHEENPTELFQDKIKLQNTYAR